MKVTVNKGWLKQHLGSRNLILLDARSRGSYKESHIRGARHAALFHYFVPGTDEKGLSTFQKDLAERLGALGLTGKETVVVYESQFGMRAARVAWMLRYAGSERVFILEGGFQAWKRSRYPSEGSIPKIDPRSFELRPNRNLLATADETAKIRKGTILDVRTLGEYKGSESRECDDRRGRIPGAKWLEWTQFVDKHERFKNGPKFVAALKDRGLHKDDEIVTYCHRGARAAAAFYGLRFLGFTNVKNYFGSWHEWSGRKDLPVEMSAQQI